MKLTLQIILVDLFGYDNCVQSLPQPVGGLYRMLTCGEC